MLAGVLCAPDSPRHREQFPEAAKRIVPGLALARLMMREDARGADDGAHFGQRRHRARTARLDKHVPQRGRFHRSGYDGNTATVRDKLVQELVLRAATDDMNDFDF